MSALPGESLESTLFQDNADILIFFSSSMVAKYSFCRVLFGIL
jgi:hypothetical protein